MQIGFRFIIVIIFLLSFGIGVSLSQEETENSLSDIASDSSVGDTSNVEKSASEEPTDDYVIGVEDVLSITVREHEELSSPSTPVGPDGKINLPYINAVRAAGLTAAQLQESISQLFKEKGMKLPPEVTVTIIEYKSKKIVIFGEVIKSGVQNFAAIPSLVDAIAEAGGYTPNADLSAVQIIS